MGDRAGGTRWSVWGGQAGGWNPQAVQLFLGIKRVNGGTFGGNRLEVNGG